ncbi:MULTISPECIES: hypothetical protein [unclassified Aminobacter]|uniref:hypothetical protein n=1 Tax=unclassified Aminobacter TaxID=2644704 RepID=UPI000465803E|nr:MULTISPECIES: hypothetical protein [unclassified Aminobacter]TWH35565.1 hypothetical protein L611_001200000460 [Aminobacter sp. J15]
MRNIWIGSVVHYQQAHVQGIGTVESVYGCFVEVAVEERHYGYTLGYEVNGKPTMLFMLHEVEPVSDYIDPFGYYLDEEEWVYEADEGRGWNFPLILLAIMALAVIGILVLIFLR